MYVNMYYPSRSCWPPVGPAAGRRVAALTAAPGSLFNLLWAMAGRSSGACDPFTRDSTVFCDPHAAGAVSVSAVRVCTCFLSISDRDPFPAGHPVMAQLCKCGSQGSGHMQGGSECSAVPGGLGCGQRAAGFALGLLRASIVKVAVSFATGGVAPSPPSPWRNLRFKLLLLPGIA